MKMRLEQLLNLAAATVTLAAAFGLDPLATALSLAAINVGFAVSACLPR
jgi:multisubunit Na+/H+ antiporter MnhC subunit